MPRKNSVTLCLGVENLKVATVELRPFAIVPSGWAARAPSTVRIHVAEAVIVNATAALRPRSPDFGLLLGEIRLLWSGVRATRAVPFLVRPELARASSHVQRFVTEGAALAVTTSLAHAYGWNLRHGFPIHVDLGFKWRGPRPDLLFPISGGRRVAGESRGRRSDSPALSLRTEQRHRLNELAAWQSGPHGSQWFMVWCWFTRSATFVDFFDPGDPRPMEAQIPQTTARTVERLWSTAPELDIELLGMPARGAWLRTDVFESARGDGIDIFIAVFPESVPEQLIGAHRVGQAGVQVAVADRMVAVAHEGGGMDAQDVAGLLRNLDEPA